MASPTKYHEICHSCYVPEIWRWFTLGIFISLWMPLLVSGMTYGNGISSALPYNHHPPPVPQSNYR